MFCTHVNAKSISGIKSTATEITIIHNTWIFKMFCLKMAEYFVPAGG